MELKLKPHETMQQRLALERLAVDADNVHRAVRNNPGIHSRRAIAVLTGLSLTRVEEVMRQINSGHTGHVRIDYGTVKPRGGPYSGREVTGWYAMNVRRHHLAMDQADEHSALVEIGVRRSRLVRFAQAHGIAGAELVVNSIAERLGLSIEAMAESDLKAFEELLLEVAEDA